MKRLFLVLALIALGVCGCKTPYVMKLSSGVQITTANKPKLNGSEYHYKDAKGEQHRIPQGRVLEIYPASMAPEQAKFQPANPHPKHWWQFWK